MPSDDSAFDVRSPFPIGESPFRMKGMMYHAAIAWVRREVPGGLDAVLRELPGEDWREFFTQTFVASGWYDVFASPLLSLATSRALGMDTLEFTRMRARQQAAEDLRGVYRLLLRLVSAETTARYLPKITTQIFDFGTAESRVLGKNHVEGVRTGTPTGLAPWYAAAASDYVAHALAASGAKDPVVRVETEPGSPAHGVSTAVMRFDFRWA